jgi:hypothetical protein
MLNLCKLALYENETNGYGKERMNNSFNIFQCVYELFEEVYLQEKLHDTEHLLADVCFHEKQDVD